MANRVKTWSAEVLTSADLNAEFNNIYSGSIDRTEGRFGTQDDVPFTLGSSADTYFEFNTDQSTASTILGLDGTSNSLIIMQQADMGTDWGIGAAATPTLFICGSDSGSTSEYISFRHDNTNARINVQSGNLGFHFAGGTASFTMTHTDEPVLASAQGDFGNGTTYSGAAIELGSNTNGTNTAAAYISLEDKGGTQYYIWPDDTGVLRIGTTKPLSASDTSGTVVGSQS